MGMDYCPPINASCPRAHQREVCAVGLLKIE